MAAGLSWRRVTVRHFADSLVAVHVATATDAIVWVDFDGRIVLVNARAERMFGYGRDELAGQLVEILVPDALQAGHPVHRAGYVADLRPRPMGAGIELAGRRRDGSTFPAEISLSAIDADEGILVSAAIRDLSDRLEILAVRDRLMTKAERDRLERQHQQAQRLESLGQLAGAVADGYSTLLAVILNHAAFAREKLAREASQVDGQSVCDNIRQIQLVAERATRLTRQLLAFSHREVIRPRALSLNDVIVGMEPGRYACLKVSDGGTGMPREVVDRAFEPFFSTKAKGQGSGLGLATVHGIVTQAYGYVQIHSEPGIGTAITILLPAASQRVPGTPPPQAAAGDTGETVLVVEDEIALREATRRILACHGYQVITAANGRDAVEVADNYPGGINLLVTDVIMPQMPGKEAADRIRARYPAVKVLFMSGYAEGILSDHGVLEAGINLLEKPFTEKSLLAKLREVMALTADQTNDDAGSGGTGGPAP
jgi:two-component system, cell cycle sensor histidine kinase and response regulator CckA